MSEMNPIVIIQMLMQYQNYTSGQRIFKFTKNNTLRIHKESEDEMRRRKSFVSEDIRKAAQDCLRNSLKETIHGRVGTVYIDPAMKKIAVPIQMSTSQSGFGILPTGSRVYIPEGKIVRAFTYWEKVNDIDLSCFGLSVDGKKKEFSWRNMWYNQNAAISFSGDQTSGYNGGSEYFDINLKLIRDLYPDFRYVVFCDNIFSGCGAIHFKDCFAKAGFMVRDEMTTSRDKIFDPKAVQTSFMLNTDSSFSYMFAIDLDTREMVWLNLSRDGDNAIAGNDKTMSMILDYMTITDVFNVYDLFDFMCEKHVKLADHPSIIVSDSVLEDTIDKEKQLIIHSWDIERMMAYLG